MFNNQRDPLHPYWVLHLLKSLYGLKQAPRIWYLLLCHTICNIGFKPLETDPCLYINVKIQAFIAVFVDDILIVAPNVNVCNSIFNSLAVHFKIKNLGRPSTFLGNLNLTFHDNGSISIDQIGYIDQILAGYHMENAKPSKLPINPFVQLQKRKPDERKADQDLYTGITGSLGDLAVISRPDISFTVSQLCQYNSDPSPTHLTASFDALRYLIPTRHYRITYGSGNLDPVGYSDSDFANRLDDRKSVTGYVFMLNNGMVMWQSHTQDTVALSTKDAEYIALSDASREAIARTQFLTELLIEHDIPQLYCDNTSAITISQNPVHYHRTKHIDIKYHHVRHLLSENRLAIDHIPSALQPADILTKALKSEKYKQAIRNMGFDTGNME